MSYSNLLKMCACLILVLCTSGALADVTCLRCPSFPSPNSLMVGNGGLWVTELMPDSCNLQWSYAFQNFVCGGSGAPTNASYVVMGLDATLTNERVLTAGTAIDITDGGAGGAATILVEALGITTGLIANDAVTDGKLRHSGALSVIGRAANSVGSPADISATLQGQVLRVGAGPVLGFGAVDLSDTDAVTGLLPAGNFEGYDRVQEESANLTRRRTINFIGTDFTCTDNAGTATTDCRLEAVGWIDDGGEVRLTTSTDEVEIGSAGTLAAKVAINGDANETQLLIQENSTQTANGFVYENSSAVDLVVIEGGGDMELGSSAGGLHAAKFAIDGSADETQIHVQGNSTQTTNIMTIENSGLTDLLRVTNTGVAVGGSGAVITNIISASATLDFANPGTNACTAAQTITVTGASAGNPCFLGFTPAVTDITFECQITASNTCSIRACKWGNVAEDPASGTFRCNVFTH